MKDEEGTTGDIINRIKEESDCGEEATDKIMKWVADNDTEHQEYLKKPTFEKKEDTSIMSTLSTSILELLKRLRK